MFAPRKWKRSLALILVISLMIGILWTPALADAISSDDGTSGDPGEIVTSIDETGSDDAIDEIGNQEDDPDTSEMDTSGDELIPTQDESEGTVPSEETEYAPEETESDGEPSEAIPEVSEPVESSETTESVEPTESVETVETPAPAESAEPTPSEESTPTADPAASETPTSSEEPVASGEPTTTEAPVPTEEVPPADNPLWGAPGMDGPSFDEPVGNTISTVALEDAAAEVGGEYYSTLKEAITAAGSGAVINVCRDVTENIELIDVENVILNLGDFKIIGKASTKPVVGIHNSTVTINGGTITGGAPTSSSGGRGIVSVDSKLTLNNSSVVDNNGYQKISTSYKVYGVYCYSGGIFAQGGELTMNDCTVQNNTNTSTSNNKEGGGIYALECQVHMTGCTIQGNTANGSGAGLYLSKGDATVENCIFTENAAGYTGGAIYIKR